MPSMTRLLGSCLVASVALLVTSASASDKARPIIGKLSEPGHTVIALAATGKAKSVRAARGSFRIVPPAKRVTCTCGVRTAFTPARW
jgi:hypothetical protein